MLEQGIEGYLDRDDLTDWREAQARMVTMEKCPEKYSSTEIEMANLREMVLLSRFYDTHGLDKTRSWDFSPIHGAITEIAFTIGFTAEGDE